MAKDERDVGLLDYSNALNQLVAIGKKDLEEIKSQINSANYQLSTVKDKIFKDTTEFESWKRDEKLKFTNDMNKRQNEIIANQNRINNEVQQQERITSDLRLQQTKFETLNQERIAFKEELVKLEGKKIEIEDRIKQAEALFSSATNAQNQGAMALSKAAEETEKTRLKNIELVIMNDQLEKRAKKIEEDSKNLEDLKEFVEPKLRAIKDEQESLDKTKTEIAEKSNKLQQTIADERILFQSLVDKKSQLDKDTSAFLSQKDEFSRQQMLSGK